MYSSIHSLNIKQKEEDNIMSEINEYAVIDDDKEVVVKFTDYTKVKDHSFLTILKLAYQQDEAAKVTREAGTGISGLIADKAIADFYLCTGKDLRFPNEVVAIGAFLAAMGNDEARFKASTGVDALPRCWTQAKSNIVACWEAGGKLDELGTVSKMKAWSKAEKERVKQAKLAEQMEAFGQHNKEEITTIDGDGNTDAGKPEFDDDVGKAISHIEEMITELRELGREGQVLVSLTKAEGAIENVLNSLIQSAAKAS